MMMMKKKHRILEKGKPSEHGEIQEGRNEERKNVRARRKVAKKKNERKMGDTEQKRK
jgi:hypothetical protein